MLENKYVEQYDCHYSRFIASWYNVGGRNVSCMFKRWLKENFPLLTEQDINAMANMMTSRIAVFYNAEIATPTRSPIFSRNPQPAL